MKNYIRINTGFLKIDYIICITCFVFIALIAIFVITKSLLYYSFDWHCLSSFIWTICFVLYMGFYFYILIKVYPKMCELKAIDINHNNIIFYKEHENIVIEQNNIDKFLLVENGNNVQIKVLSENQNLIFDFPISWCDGLNLFFAEKIRNISPYINNFEYINKSQLCNPKINKRNVHFMTYLIIFASICAACLFFIDYPSEKYKNLIVTKDFETSSKIAEYLISNDYNVSISNDDLYTLQVKNTAKRDSYTALLLLWENNKLNSDTHLVKGFNIKSLIKRNINGIIDANYKLLNKNEADNKELLIDLVVEQNADIEKIKIQITNLLQASIENLKAENIKFSIEKR